MSDSFIRVKSKGEEVTINKDSPLEDLRGILSRIHLAFIEMDREDEFYSEVNDLLDYMEDEDEVVLKDMLKVKYS